MNFVLMRPVIQTHRNPNRQHLGGLRPSFQQPIPVPVNHHSSSEIPHPVIQESPKGIILSDSVSS